MNTALPPLDSLRQKVYGDPGLQAQLFQIHDTDEFILIVEKLAQDIGLSIPTVELRKAIQQGQRNWFERNLPW